MPFAHKALCIHSDHTIVPGFELLENKQKCKAAAETDVFLLFAVSKSVGWFTLKTNQLRWVAENLNQAIGITYDGEYVYWTDVSFEQESIMKAEPNDSEFEV